ncbi:choline transporter-like protein 2 [Phymastichus coffea]|uniref:choline transporter-like protein 2 n=1 Tax=Phymastichus coffea TaxID=108790 RepID=UPI00273B963D|nr:choline transporter-like protein 2 [Phymastichus coffea]
MEKPVGNPTRSNGLRLFCSLSFTTAELYFRDQYYFKDNALYWPEDEIFAIRGLNYISTNSSGIVTVEAAALAIVASVIYLFLLRYCPKTIVFTVIAVFFALLLGAIAYLSYQLTSLTNYEQQRNTVHILGGLVIAFILSLTLFVVYRKKVLIACGIIKEATEYHLGTISLGSLFMTIAQGINAIIRTTSDSAKSNGNICTRFFNCFMRACRTVKNIVKYINSNAYIMCALHGTSFYQSAKDAFNLLLRNATHVVMITHVTNIIIVLGNLLVSGIIISIIYFVNGSHGTLPYVLTGVIACVMSYAIFEVLKIAVNTIFICVLEDYERNDGSTERPYFMSHNLRKLLMQDQ